MQFGQVHHIEYYVNDLSKSNLFWDWFMPTLGYKKVSEWDQGVSWEHPNKTYICFVQVLDNYLSHINNRQAQGLNHIAFKGGDLDFLNKMESSLKSKGIPILKRDGNYLCFEDPNQFAVEVYAD